MASLLLPAVPTSAQASSRTDFSVGPDPIVRIGSIAGDDPYLFESARKGLLRADGSVLIFDSNELRIFGLDGQHTETIGREGQGPGEFQSVAWLQESGPSLQVYDWQQQRITTFQDGEISTARVAYPGTGTVPALVALGPDGSMAFVSTQDTPTMHEDDRNEYVVSESSKALLRVRDGSTREIFRDSYDRDFIARVGDRVTFGDEPLGPSLHVGSGSDFIVTGSSNSRALRVVRWDGSVSELELELPEISFDDRGRASFAQAYLDGTTSDARRSTRELVLREMEWPASVPFIEMLVVDSDDRIWVKPHWLQGTAEQWVRIHPNTGTQELVILRGDAELLDARDSKVLLRTTDQFGTPIVEVWKLGASG